MGNDRIENALYGEIPTEYPTILQQVDASINSPETVDLVLINGGINDVNFRRVVNPIVDRNELVASIEEHCYVEMKTLLERITSKFQNAKVIVIGYYAMFSEESDLTAMTVFLSLAGLRLKQINGALTGVLLTQAFKADVVARAALFADEAEKNLQRAIDDTNVSLGSRRVFFGPA